MTAAQLVLLGFIFYWLAGQYNEQKQFLLREVGESWSASEQQMLDSLLMKEFVHPVIDRNNKLNFKFEFNTDSLRLEPKHNTNVSSNCTPMVVAASPGLGDKMVVRIADTAGGNTSRLTTTTGMTRNNLILKSVKLIINGISDSSGQTLNISTWSSEGDTNLLKQAFLKRLQTIDPRMRVFWVAIRGDDTLNQKRGTFTFRTTDGKTSLQAGVTGFSLYLFRKILPQVLFAVFLLALTLLAFILSFRGYKAQVILNRQRSDFIHNMSHELKTPVATVKVALEALRNFNAKNDPVKTDEYLDMASAEASRLELLVNRVMQFPGNGEDYFLNPAPVDLRDIVSEVLRTVRPRLDTELAILTVSVPEIPCMISADALHVKGVIMNLLDNSLKYCKGTAEINLGLSLTPGSVCLSLIDKGNEIPSEYREKIFDKFFRVPTGDAHTVKGHGLGLSYAKSVMDLHGGKISYQASTGVGNTFELFFPLLQI